MAGVPHLLCVLHWPKNTKTGCKGHAQPQLCSPIRTHPVPILDGQPWEGMLGVLRSLNLQRPLLPDHPSGPIIPGAVMSPPCGPRPRPGPTHLPSSLGYLLSTKLPKTSPAFPHHLSVCPQGPSSRVTIGDITEATVQMGFRPVGVGWAVFRVDLTSPL